MPIDASIPLQAGNRGGFSLRDILRDAEERDIREREMTIREQQAARQQADYDRQQRSRGSLADLMLADQRNMRGGGQTQPTGLSTLATQGPPARMNFDQAFAPKAMDKLQAGGMPAPADYQGRSGLDPSVPAPTSNTGPADSDYQHRWEQYVRDDPDGALAYENTQTGLTSAQFKAAHELNNAGLAILSGVNDQASYDLAKKRAQALYGRYGFDVNDFNLPDEYSPELVANLRNEAMDTRNQLIQAQRQQKLDADISDDEADNDRADRNTASIIADRQARRAETQRYHNQRDTTTRRGQDFRTRDTQRGQDFRSRDTQRGQDIGASRPRGGGRGGGGAVTATGPGGVQIHYDAGKKTWVDDKGNPVK